MRSGRIQQSPSLRKPLPSSLILVLSDHVIAEHLGGDRGFGGVHGGADVGEQDPRKQQEVGGEC